MDAKTYFDSNGELVLPSLLRGEGFSMSSSSSALHLSDVSYENMSAYIERLSQQNPNLNLGSLGPPILKKNTNSGPSVGASSFITDATYGANFQRTSNFNIEPYQNLPSSPLSVSSRNMSSLAMEGIESQLHQIDQGAYGRGCLNDCRSSRFKGKERELLDYLPQMSKNPRFDVNAENALHQYVIQQLLQKQEPLVFQNYNQQLKALLQQNELHKLKQKEIQQSQYVAVPTQQQMKLYLQHLAKSSIPAIRPIPSGICARRLTQFLYHLQHRPSDNAIAYWRKFVAEYYAPGAKKRWCFSLYNGLGERCLSVFSQLAMDGWHCDLCSSNSGKGFEASFDLLPRLYKTYFESGVSDELLFLDLPHEYILPSGMISLRYEKAVQETVYEKFRVVREGQLRIIFRNDLKILAWEFCAHRHDEVVPRSSIAPQVNELARAAQKCQGKGGPSKVAVQNLHSTCKTFVAVEGQLMRNLDSMLVNDLGFTKKYIRCLQIAEIVNGMTDLMTFSLSNKIGPIESLEKYSQQRSTSNTQKKQDEIPASTSEALFSGFAKYPNPNAYRTALTDPKSSCQSSIQRSPVSGTSSSALPESDNKTQEQMIDSILQQMESNTQVKASLSKKGKVEVEVENPEDGPTADVASRNKGKGKKVGSTSTAVWRSVPKNGPKQKKESSKSTSGNISVKEELDDDIYKDLYLPEAIRDMDRGFFRIGGLDDEWNNMAKRTKK